MKRVKRLLRGASGVVLTVAWPVVVLGQQPGWVQDVPWIRSSAFRVQSWSPGETFSIHYDDLVRNSGSLAMGFAQIGTFSRLSICAGPQVKLSPQITAQVRVGGMARRWTPAQGIRATVRPNLHLSLRGDGSHGQAVMLGVSFVPEGRLPRVQARDELVIQLRGVAEHHEQRLQARCTWSASGVAMEWQWLAGVDVRSRIGLCWRMLPGFVGILGIREFESRRWSFGILYGVRHQGVCLALGMEAC